MASGCAQMVMVQNNNNQRPWESFLPPSLLSLDVATRLRTDDESTKSASNDFGSIVHVVPAAVLYPNSIDDVVFLVKFSYNSQVPFGIAPKGRGHSIRGQAMAPHNGVVVDMRSLNNNPNITGSRIRVSREASTGSYYADVGGEQLWIDVLNATLEHGLAPTSWTDYLYITVGGTLSNAGISGQCFRYGPQISNVYEMDVITGKGEFVTCSPHENSELFYGVLGGLGQFGIIARARIAIAPAPKRVKWVRMLYDDFSEFTRDQEGLISMEGLDYVEGSLILHQNPINNWRSSFFTQSDHSKILSLAAKHGIIYTLEVAKYYDYDDASSVNTIDQEVEELVDGLSFLCGFKFTRDVSYVEFLNRVRSGELKLQSKGLWEVPHPWLNLFVPKSRISDFDSRVFKDIILKQDNIGVGPILVYPMTRNKWDERMSAVVPEEEVFYAVGLLHSAAADTWEKMDEQNREIVRVCEEGGMNVKQYLPHLSKEREWGSHFGPKWSRFQERKAKFDPRMILSPGQTIFISADVVA